MLLYEMIAGRVPFDGETMGHIIVSLLEHEPPPLSRFAPGAPAELGRIVRRCLSKERDDRYQTAGELAIALGILRRRLDLRHEREHSRAHGADVAVPPVVPDGRRPALARSPANRVPVRGPAGRQGAGRRSSAEYDGTTFRRHTTAIILIALAVLAALAAAIVFVDVRPESALTERDTILLTTFVNTTGDPVFDGTLERALAVQLGQSPFLTIFSEDRVRDASGSWGVRRRRA